MLVQLGVFRLNLNKYSPYEVNFDDVSGLAVKAFVKIAGVKVGWIEKITLLSDCACTRVRIMIKNRYQIHEDAYVIIRQEGLLGSRYLEIVPGSPDKALLRAGTLFVTPGKRQASLETLLCQCQDIVGNIRSVSQSLDKAFGGEQQAKKIENLVDNLARASEHIATFSDTLNRVVVNNEQSLNTMIGDCQVAANQAKQLVPQLRETVADLAHVFEHDFDRVADKLEKTAATIDRVVSQAQDGIASVSSISKKIDGGQGILGKLVNDNQVYEDIKSVTQTFRDSIERINKMGVEVDAHGEAMLKSDKDYGYQSNKGYLTMRMCTSPHWFYTVGIVNAEKGWPIRTYTCESYCNDHGEVINPSDLVLDNGTIKVAPQINRICVKRNDTRVDMQVGKEFFDCLTLRAGTFEGTFGVGVDWALPINSSAVHWLMSLETYDLYGQNRFLCDRRPHLKWINRVYLFDNIYFTFGADDFISRYNANGFFGAGLRFSDDDLKHVASKIGIFGTHN